MKLYHGTGIRNLDSILNKGLQPRNRKKGNWKEFPSRKDMVYLSTAYAPFFALNSQDSEGVILEVNLDDLDASKLFPDEDGIAQAISQQEKRPLNIVHQEVKNNLEAYQHYAMQSIDLIGNICYQGTIEPSKIKRLTTIEFKKRPDLAMICCDPSISVMNYRLIGNKYRTFTEWLMSYRPDFDVMGFGDQHQAAMYELCPEMWVNNQKMFANREGLMTAILSNPSDFAKRYTERFKCE